jgi:hypothetical protein
MLREKIQKLAMKKQDVYLGNCTVTVIFTITDVRTSNHEGVLVHLCPDYITKETHKYPRSQNTSE